jgi:methyltransferase
MSVFFWMVLAAVVLQRLLELVLSKRNEAWLRLRGAYEVGRKHYKYLGALHILFFATLIAEIFFYRRNMPRWWWMPFSLFLLAQGLRFWSIGTLGRRWTTRIMALPGASVVTTGPYRYLRHPNYTAVVLELLSLPLIFGAYYTALVFSVLNAALMRIRIPAEERALSQQTVESPRRKNDAV